jgi:predicted ATPase/class 3 adenylate cyclase
MPGMPAGTVTFLLTDIERSTSILQRLGDAGYAKVLGEHRRLLSAACRQEGGEEIDMQGDAMLVAFPRAGDAVTAAIAGQRALLGHSWPPGAEPRVRMGLHTGEPRIVAGAYVGLDVHRAARICAAGHGGQILTSVTTSALIEGSVPAGLRLRDLGTHRLKDLLQPERIFQILHPDLPDEFPPLRSLDVFPNNLPRQLTSFIGREGEIPEVKRLLSTRSLVTLTGSGGCGKTRLALEVAAELIDAYADGVWLVELATLSEPDLVLQTVAAALGLREVRGRARLATLLDYLRLRELLLVLDNCEHLVAACAELAEASLRSCPRLKILATSREPLGVSGETVWRVPSLSIPEREHVPPVERLMQYEAIRLFVERVAAVEPAFTLTPQNAAVVCGVCRRLDGIPLAIELAAARMRALSLAQIAARLDASFGLLTGGARTALPRQQTLRGALDWSYDLLLQNERVLLRRLSVFVGGWTLEAAETVCVGGGVEAKDILDLLTQLVFKSLVLMEPQEGQARYRVLEAVRQYGRDRLEERGEAANLRKRHLEWYLRLAERAERELVGADQSAWFERLEAEHDNLRAALEWSKFEESDGDAGIRLAGALWRFWDAHGHLNEGRKWLEAMLPRSQSASPSVQAKALAGAGFLAWRQADYDGSIRLCTMSLALFQELGDLLGTGQVLYVLGMAAEGQGDFERAKRLLLESLAVCRKAGDKRRMAVSLNSIGEVARCQSDFAAARASYEESLALRREVGDKRGVGIALCNLGHVALHQADYEDAARFFGEALGLVWELKYKLGIAENLAGLGAVAAAEGHHAPAARLLGAATNLLNVLGAPLQPPDQAEYERSVAAARAGLSEAAFAEAWAEGKAMALNHAIHYALVPEAANPLREDRPADRESQPPTKGLD